MLLFASFCQKVPLSPIIVASLCLKMMYDYHIVIFEHWFLRIVLIGRGEVNYWEEHKISEWLRGVTRRALMKVWQYLCKKAFTLAG